jgi:hypothetical protein
MTQFGNLGLVQVVKVLPCAEDLDGRNAGSLDPAQRGDGQPMIDK